MSRDDRPRPAPGEAVERDSREGRRVGFVGPRLPTSLSCRLLSCSLEAPARVVAGTPAAFHFHVKNRAPMSLTLACSSSRSWGWTVDGVPEAGAGRFDPPATAATVALGPRERRTFTGRWDGQFLETDERGERWTAEPGIYTLTAYVAVENWRYRGVFASTDLAVESGRG
ncbi:hypothetical protein [Natrononativus amylolyticus]|uniref:hypothetical protein n=1 Tax=Natrononativus amylolyticus TaxID=2963434 RepID=UPI0020CDCC29|nr:hypothetical protein [Natrononativus amylolyticus]